VSVEVWSTDHDEPPRHPFTWSSLWQSLKLTDWLDQHGDPRAKNSSIPFIVLIAVQVTKHGGATSTRPCEMSRSLRIPKMIASLKARWFGAIKDIEMGDLMVGCDSCQVVKFESATGAIPIH
jgi:hypothetical protein